jgi:predicted protein tyrosine phosphatase
MNVFVCPKNNAHDTAKKVGATHWLCILDPGDRIYVTPRLQKLTTLHLRFEDVLEETDRDAPTLQDVERMLRWGEAIPEDATVVINCFAGVSRSTAAALALMTQKTRDPNDAARRLLAQRPTACPNPIITKHADAILGMGGALFERGEEIARARIEWLTNN